MKSREASLPHETLILLLDYNPATGVFTWKNKISTKVVVGEPAGFFDNGYWRVSLYGVQYMMHRLAWFYVTGKWPEEELDHINMDRSDNRFCNLREATKSENMQNRPKQKNNTTGFKGVSRHHDGKRFTAQIHRNRKKMHLGVFNTAEEAHAAYAEASKVHHKYGRTA